MRKYLAVVAVALAVAAGCSSSGGSKTSSASAGASSGDSRAPGVTEDAIKVGVTYVDLKAIRKVAKIDHGDYEKSYRVMFDRINAQGGIDGRKIVPVFAPVNPIGTQPAEAACVKLTQDDPVFVVVGFFLNDGPLCYLETHRTAVIGGQMTPERLQRAKAPWFTTEPGSDQETDVVNAFADKHLLGGKLAVFAIAKDRPLVDGTVLPLLKRRGITPVASSVLDVPDNDAAAANAATAVIAEKFKAAGATKVLIVGDGGLGWANGVEKTAYRPQLLLTNPRTIATYAGDSNPRDLSVVKDAIVGSTEDENIFTEPKMKACLDLHRKAGTEIPDPDTLKPSDPNPAVAAYEACKNGALLEAILKKAGKKLDYGTFLKAGESLGDFAMPGSTKPFHYGPVPARDGNAPIYLYTWNPAKKKFTST